MPKKRIEEQQQAVSDMINGSFNNKEFCELMARDHRTLQQGFTRLCVEWLVTCAKDDYRFDGRNEASHILAKDLLRTDDRKHVNEVADIYLPLI